MKSRISDKLKRRILKLELLDWILIVAALVIFTFITFLTISKFSIWFDEAFGAYMIRHYNLIDITRYTATDVHPPFFYWLLKGWSMLFGNTEIALRSMSVLFSGVAIIFGYLLIRRLFNKNAARISLIFLTFSPMLVRYGQEARMYALIAAISLAATYVLTFAIKTKKKLPWIIYGVLVSLGMWTHYLCAIIWIAHWIWRADVVRRNVKHGEFMRKFFSSEWIFAHVIAIGLYLPWLPVFISQFFVVQAFGFWIPKVTTDTIPNFLTNTIYYQDSVDTSGWLALVIIAVSITLGILASKIYKSQNKTDRESFRLIMTLAFVPVVILFLMSMPPLRSSFVDRYLITSVVGIALFVGVTLSLGSKFLSREWRNVLIGTVAVTMIIGVGNVWSLGNYNKNTKYSNQTRQIVQATIDLAEDRQPIIAASPWLYYEVSFYQTDEHPVYYLAPKEYKYGSLDMLKYNDYHKIKDISAFAKENSIVWYIGWIGESELKTPYSNWEKVQSVIINDFVNNEPAYEAIQYKINDK